MYILCALAVCCSTVTMVTHLTQALHGYIIHLNVHISPSDTCLTVACLSYKAYTDSWWFTNPYWPDDHATLCHINIRGTVTLAELGKGPLNSFQNPIRRILQHISAKVISRSIPFHMDMNFYPLPELIYSSKVINVSSKLVLDLIYNPPELFVECIYFLMCQL